jgi:hypothetical protein
MCRLRAHPAWRPTAHSGFPHTRPSTTEEDSDETETTVQRVVAQRREQPVELTRLPKIGHPAHAHQRRLVSVLAIHLCYGKFAQWEFQQLQAAVML